MIMNRTLASSTAWLFSLLAALDATTSVATEPEILTIQTDFDRSSLSISGNGFGDGPKVIVYDTFDSNDRIAGEPVQLSASQIGSWTEIHEFNIPTYSNVSRSGNNSAKIFDGETQKTNQFRLKFDGTKEFYVSYWVYLEGPKYFPGDRVHAPRTFAEDSSFKMLWVFDTDVRGDSSDVVLPTHVGGGRFYLAGNDANLVTNVGNEWWSWDHWMRISVWLKANPNNPTEPGVIHFDTLSEDKGHTQRVYNVPVFDEDGPIEKQYQQMNFPGWIRSIQSSNTNILYDDIYVSTGPNASARIELGNAPYLDEVTQLELLTIESWSDKNIRARVSTVENQYIKNLYLYVTNGNGETNIKGIPLISPPAQIKSMSVE